MNSEAIARQLNRLMIDRFVEEGVIASARVENAFRSVLRHHFLPREFSFGTVYNDDAIVVKRSDERRQSIGLTNESSSTMPSLLARILESAEIATGMNVLQIGTGPGYLAGLLSKLVGDSGEVTTVEIDRELSLAAAERFEELNLGNVHAICDDGYSGYAEHRPYDRIIVTASCTSPSPTWTAQLREGGSLFVPLAFTQRAAYYPMVRLWKRGDRLVGNVILGLERVGFVPIRRHESGAMVEYSEAVRDIQQVIWSRIFEAGYRGTKAGGAVLFTTFELARRIEKGDEHFIETETHAIVDALLESWSKADEPTVEEFVLSVLPLGASDTSCGWRFERDDRIVEIYMKS